jgi:hypothetical protein
MARTDKVIRLFEIDQDTYAPVGQKFILTGSSGSLTEETAEADTTVFGAGSFSTSLPTLASHSMSANSWLRNTAGYLATLKRGGTPVEFNDESMTQVGTSKTYRITNATKNYWNFNEDVVVTDAGGVIDPDDYVVNYLFGEITFDDSFTPDGAVEVSGESVPLVDFGRANSVDLSQTCTSSDVTTFELAKEENGYATFRAELKEVSMSLSAFYSKSDSFHQILNAREEILVEIDFDGSGSVVSRGVFRVSNSGLDGDVGSTETNSVDFSLAGAPEGIAPYDFQFSETSQASAAFQILMKAWVNRNYIGFDYAPDGLNEVYYDGRAIVTDASLSTAVDAIGELTISLQGSGELQEIDPNAS